MEYETEEKVLATMARALDAHRNKGFDGKEHPELIPEIKTMFNSVYPFKVEHIAAILNGGKIV
ncbi:hypothetical protein EVB32_084 [Rhizobium phage RHph_TM39]|uniref:Uncharacterized protein n=1 Tax=Rhizobium phage RHph_TM30 TaxID=2509764 RepID=A0A7S5R9E8_9CAUD|nr:hypothetical protein PQC16_gp084 [Rhizobium phage RHph_TM30]QIG71555.1 hypothetical protein EVB94_084 [Rhizobium phage RHph_TM40]QIG71918.1 hypothetical protein EVB95_084 [Rhizobium phage RHph_TM2_3B]QIG72280.1 hypothetical protein EVB96_084 [Rhizobium phage RHph_TM3_3_6]QIG77072.1 hypothetical protein EVB32_084 [Rhizobium phage RHph_TM39]QIG77411.1 hypothetical protein EVB61_083 [Rhizobium phage RHph_TM21B]QIG77671.1 hypothetical protein EVB64_084 [Rhizobium phage RHph_TM61]